MPRVGDPWRIDAAKAGEHALGDVIEVGCTLSEVAPDGFERRAEARERVVHGPFGGRAVVDARVDLVLQRRVLGDHRLRFEHLLRRAAGRLTACGELLGDCGDGLAHPCALSIDALGAGGVLGSGQRLGHPHDDALGDPETDPDSSELAHAPASWSWSVVSSSVSVSSTPSALSPSAVSVT